MSHDLQIAYACPHHIRAERVALSNGVLLSPKSPISGMGLLEVTRDGIPLRPEGNMSEARIVAPKAPPYRVKSTTTSLTLKTSNGVTHQVTIPAKNYRAEDLVLFFNQKLNPIAVTQEGNSIGFSDGGLGVGFTLEGSFLKALGFDHESVSIRPHKVTPSWSLVKRLQGYDVVFSKPLTPEGLLEISYTTEKRNCRRCGSTGVENDMRWDDQGLLQKATGYDLLYQNVAKVILTRLGSNPYHPQYGSRVFDLIGRKSTPNITAIVRETVANALDKFQRQQRVQQRLQALSLEETLLRVESITANYIGDDLTAVLCNIVVRSASGQPVSVNLVFSVPGSIQLNGDLT